MFLGGMEEMCISKLEEDHNKIFQIFNDPATILIGSLDKNYDKVPKDDLTLFSEIVSETPSIKWFNGDKLDEKEIEK